MGGGLMDIEARRFPDGPRRSFRVWNVARLSRQAPSVHRSLEPAHLRTSGSPRELSSLWEFALLLQSVYLGHRNRYDFLELLLVVEAIIIRHVLSSLSERVHTPLDAAGLPQLRD